MFIMRHGGGTNRPGTTFDGEVKDSTKRIRLIPFIFDSTQTCMLEFGDLYMRIHQNGAQVTDSTKNITAITNANPCQITSAAHGFSNGQEVYITGITGAIGLFLNGRNFKIAGVAANTFTLQYMDGSAVNSTTFGAYTSGGTASRIYEIVSPYAVGDLSTLRFVQSGDVVTITHPSYQARELTRTSATSWAFATITIGPTIATPTGIGFLEGGGAGALKNIVYYITAVSDETGEESLYLSAGFSTHATFTTLTISWSAVTGASTFRVYAADPDNGVAGFLGFGNSSTGLTFRGSLPTPDTSINPPTARDPISSASNYPTAVAYIQNRRAFGNSNSNPETVWMTQTGRFKNLCRSVPTQDSDAVTFAMTGRQVNHIKHLLMLSKPLIFTDTGEHTIEGDAAGTILPSAINPRQQSYNGSGDLAPLVVGGNALYVQARGSIVRDLAFEFQSDSYRGNDLTIFSAHLFDGYTIVDWAYQQVPHSVIWVVRSDGVLLSLTYVREHQIFAWARHDTDGTYENVACIPEGTEDAVYVTVKRTINGATKRFVERMSSRTLGLVENCNFTDSSLSYDGRNSGATTMTLTSAGTWLYTDTLTLTASAPTFAASDVGKEYHLRTLNTDGTQSDIVRLRVTAFTSTTVVSVQPNKTVPVAFRAVATTTWSKAITALSGLWNLEGKQVSVLADGLVAASPHNSQYSVLTVTNGQITLDRAAAAIHVGLPFISDLQTLDIDLPQSEPMVDKNKMVGEVTMHVEKTRGVFTGGLDPDADSTDPLANMDELKIRDQDDSMDQGPPLVDDQVNILIRPEWNSNGRVLVRQVDPLPMTILAVYPRGYFPARTA